MFLRQYAGCPATLSAYTAKQLYPERALDTAPLSAWMLITRQHTTLKRTPLKRKSKSEGRKLKDKLWELCKQLTRREHGNTCYTCRYSPLEGGNWHTGHFIPDSTSSVELRYDLKNLRPQCRNCNFWKSGDWPTYEKHLIADHGEEYVAELKARNIRTKGLQYDSLWYKAKIEEYEAML